CLDFRPSFRSLWPAHSADGQRGLFFDYRAAVRICAELHGVPDFARAFWHRHGRRVGSGRFAGHGSGATPLGRSAERNSADRLLHRLSVGSDRSSFLAAPCRLALDVFDRRLSPPPPPFPPPPNPLIP